MVWQVKTTGKKPDSVTELTQDSVKSGWTDWVKLWQPDNHGMLKVRLKPEQTSTDPCTIPPSSAYRGQENHLYRVEVHAGGVISPGDSPKGVTGSDNPPTFKWSRDNGSDVAAWLDTDGNDLLVDSTRGFEGVQWVEVLDDTKELRGEPGTLVKVTNVEAGISSP